MAKTFLPLVLALTLAWPVSVVVTPEWPKIVHRGGMVYTYHGPRSVSWRPRVPNYVHVALGLRSARAGAFVIGVCAGSANDTSVSTAAVDMTAGGSPDADLLVGHTVTDATGGPSPDITDDSSNDWTPGTDPADDVNAGSNILTRRHHMMAPTVDSSMVFSVSPGDNSFPSICVQGFSGMHQSAVTDQENYFNVGDTCTTGSITPSENNTVLTSGAGFNVSLTGFDVDLASFTESASVGFGAGVHYALGVAYEIQTTATARNPTWSATLSEDGSCSVQSWKQAAAGGATFPAAIINNLLRGGGLLGSLLLGLR